jgi:hypothetical protein
MIEGSGFIRGLSGDPQYIRPTGEVITDPGEMRCDCLAFQEHTERVHQRTKGEILVAVSYGDLMTNEEYVAWVAEPCTLFCRRSEEARLSQGYLYHALGVEQDSTPWAGIVEFKQSPDGPRVLDEAGEDLTERLRLVFTGPPVVWKGEPLNPEATVPRWKADLRHVLTLIASPLPTGGKMLIGEDRLMKDVNRLCSAVRGKRMRLPLTWPSPQGPSPLPEDCVEALVEDAQTYGYTRMPTPEAVQEIGQFALENHHLVCRFKPGLYPHNLLGINVARATWINVQVGGVSTRSGCTLAEAAQLMYEAGADHAIGLDQGADEQILVKVGDYFYFKPSFIYRSRVSAALVWTVRQAAALARYAA